MRKELFMNWVIDIVLASVFILTVVVCAARGFVKSIWWLLRAVLSLGASFLFGHRFGTWLMERFILGKFTDVARASLESIVHENNGSFDISEAFSSMPESFRSLLARFGADASTLQGVYGGSSNSSASDLNALASDIATPVARVVSEALGYVAVFLIVFIVVTVLGWVVRLIAELPVLRSVNHLLGGVFGVACGFIYLWVICLAISAFVESGIAETESRALMQLAQESYLFRFFCGFSPLDYINISAIVSLIES